MDMIKKNTDSEIRGNEFENKYLGMILQLIRMYMIGYVISDDLLQKCIEKCNEEMNSSENFQYDQIEINKIFSRTIANQCLIYAGGDKAELLPACTEPAPICKADNCSKPVMKKENRAEYGMVRIVNPSGIIEVISLENLEDIDLPRELIQEDIFNNEHPYDERNKELLKCLVENCTERELKLLSLRFGLEAGKIRTSEQVASMLGISRERVLAEERAIIRRFKRRPRRSDKLREYLD